tara:strand:- start:29 stop:241 length:213 start_codon:yes stop_codon:yes gene_type:complete
MEKKTKTSLFQEILDRTTLDDEAIKAITLAEEYIEQRKNNLSYIIKNFPFAVGIIGASNLCIGIVLGLLF